MTTGQFIMAVPAGIKLDDGTNTSFVSKCFPARRVFGQSDDAGAWLVAQKAEQKRHFQAVLSVKPKTYAQIKAERREKEKAEAQKKARQQGHGTQPPPGSATTDTVVEGSVTEGLLDGFFLLKHCCVEDPSDVCSVNISGQDLTEVKEEDFTLFDNVAYVNAGENLLPFEAFRNFSIVRELELPLNGLRGLRIELDDYPHLEVLDLSYNNLSKDDVLTLGLLPKLKVLYLTGNQLRSIPTDIAKPFKVDTGESEQLLFPRYGHLEMLFLDDNQLTDLATFASLAGLKKLKRLNLDKNEIHSVPHLKALSGKHVEVHNDLQSAASTPRRRKSAKGKKRSGSRPDSRTSSRASSTTGKPAKEASEDQKEAAMPATPVTPATTVQQAAATQVAPATGTEPAAATPEATATATAPAPTTPAASIATTEPTPATPVASIATTEPLLATPAAPATVAEPAPARVAQLAPVTSDESELEAKVAALQAALVTDSTSTFSSSFATELPPPFPELEHLSLAYNKISDEEGLLAVAAWPMLKELIIHNNPLTTNSSGDPPLLKRYLQDRLGIQMVRRKPDKVNKPHIQVPAKSHRKVKEVPRPLPKRPLQLMLEAGPDTPALPTTAHQPHPPQTEPRPPSQPLPPILPSEERPKTDPGTRNAEDRLYEEKMTRTQSWTEENFAKDREEARETTAAPVPKATVSADEPVFLTQVDDQAEEQQEEPRPAPPSPPPADQLKKDDKKRKKKKKGRKDVPEKFKGYEIFYDVPDDPDVPVAHDIQGNLRSLRLALKHSTVYRDNKVDLERLQKPFQAYQKSKVPPKPPHQNKAERLEGVLDQMKNRLTTEEINLAEILEDKKRMKEEFPEVDTLLKEIQSKYKEVRNATMKDSEVQKQSVEDALKSLHSLGDKLKTTTQATKTTATR